MKKRTLLIMSVAVALVCALAVGATLAYLTSLTGQVRNTFTVGNVTITLDEADVDAYGETGVDANGNPIPVGDLPRVLENEYKLIPGHTYTKDPTIHVDGNSEDCYLFVKVVNGLASYEATTNTIATQMTANGWSLVNGQTDVYCYNAVATAEQNVPVFGSFTLDGNANFSGFTPDPEDGTIPSLNIEITAYAVQRDGFDTAANAWTAASTNWVQGN